MSTYTPPLKDFTFLLNDVFGFQHEDLDSETIEAVFEEAGKLATDVLAPLNAIGDQKGVTLEEEGVKTAPGFKEAYEQYCEGGWNAVPFDPDYGGQGLPYALAFPIQEIWQAANMSFGLCPILNQGAVETIHLHGSQEQKDEYLEKLISGQWAGTMNITEPQAGSDLGLVRTKAEKQEDGSYKISGQKIFITYGDHDLSENIIHLTLARATNAPDDVRGLSLFAVPKFMPDGTRNDVRCNGLEHKLGIHGSPTCTMLFGENDGAVGYLIGVENMGLKYMFTMMNNARLYVGLQGVAIADRATQLAKQYAAERLQGRSYTTRERVTIDKHADIKRMLLSMQSQTDAGRALAMEAAFALDAAKEGSKEAQLLVDILTPIVKAWCSDMACEVASLGIQVQGGMGFIEETGAAQYYRDARILPIYEGTNGIQAADLVFRKVLRSGGNGIKAYLDRLQSQIQTGDESIFIPVLDAMRELTEEVMAKGAQKDLDWVAAAAMPYFKALALIAGGILLGRSRVAVQNHADKDFAKDKMQSATFFLTNILPQAYAHIQAARASDVVMG